MVDFQYMERYDIQDLRRIMALLRAPGGCPWDREQTHESIRRNMLEEAYEVVEAIDEKDPEHLKEELGDVLLQVVFHAQMAREEGLFTFDDVVDGVAQKMVFRHPHVFGQAHADDSAQALDTWDAQKREEKDQRTASDTLKAVARSLPALIRAEKIQSKAAKAGFDWPDPAPALDKLAEEADELRRAAQGDGDPEEELGDLLFAAVKAGRFLGLDSEQALTRACDKFIRRFQSVEERAGGRPLGELPLEELEALWAQAKAEEAPAQKPWWGQAPQISAPTKDRPPFGAVNFLRRNTTMNKTELIAAVAEKADLSKKDAEAAITAAVDAITEALTQGEKVHLVGFGSFEVKTRAARVGRNPRTGEEIPISEAKLPVFKAGKALKDAVAQ